MAQEENVMVQEDSKKKELKKKLESVIISAAVIIVGLLFCVLPTSVVEIIETIVLVAVLVYGGVCMLVYCFTPADFRNNSYLFKAMISLCLGLLLIFVRSFFVSAFGLVILVSGVKTALSSRVYKAVGDKKWWMELLVGVLLFALGAMVIILSNTHVAKKLVLILLGLSLIIQGVINFAFMFYLRAEKVQVEQSKAEENANETQTQVEETKEETDETSAIEDAENAIKEAAEEIEEN